MLTEKIAGGIGAGRPHVRGNRLEERAETVLHAINDEAEKERGYRDQPRMRRINAARRFLRRLVARGAGIGRANVSANKIVCGVSRFRYDGAGF